MFGDVAPGEGIVIASMRMSTARIVHMFSRILEMDVFRTILRVLEVETAMRAGSPERKRTRYHRYAGDPGRDANRGKNLLDEFKPFATEPASLSICVACVTCGKVKYQAKNGKHIGARFVA